MKIKLSILLLFIFISSFCLGQTANQFSSGVPYTLNFCYGTNNGYYGSQFNNTQLSQLQWNAGCKNLVPYLPDYFITPAPTTFIADMTGYASVGFGNNYTGVLGGVYSGNQLDSNFISLPDSPHVSYVWKGLYSPIFNSDSTVDTANNTFAYYVLKTVRTYKNYISTYEIVNEPLLTFSTFSGIPTAGQLPNLYAPYPYYVRMCRIAWYVIKKYQPTAHISLGGLTDLQGLTAFGTYTDNPGAGVGTGTGAAGSVSTAFPLPATAYVDVLIEHWYPQYTITSPINSDSYVQNHLNYIRAIDSILYSFGYNGTTYPIKPILFTETGCLKGITSNGFYGNDTMSHNYQIKDMVLTQLHGVKNGNDYALGDDENVFDPFSPMGKYGDLTPSTTTVANAPKSNNFWANATESQLLYGLPCDSVATTALSLPSSVSGAAFDNTNGNKIYVLWAKCTNNKSEVASTTFALPSGTYTRYEWNYSQIGTSTTGVTGTVSLTGTPSFFLQTQVQPPVPTPKLTHTITYSVDGSILKTTQVYSDGSIINK